MTNHDAASQLVNAVAGAIKFDQIETYIVIFALVGIAYFILRTVKQMRDPEGRSIGEMVFLMRGHKFAGRTFEQSTILELENLDELANAEDDNAKKVAEMFKAHRNDLHFYIVKLGTIKGATLRSGQAIVMTHHNLDDHEWSWNIGRHIDIWNRGTVDLRHANPASESGRLWRSAITIGRQTYHLIYYPQVSLKELDVSSGKVTLIQNPHATIEVAAWMREYAKTRRRERIDKKQREAAERYAEQMGAQAAGTAGELNELSYIEAAPRYDQQNVSERKQALHPLFASIIGVFGTILTFALLRQYNPQGDPLGQLIFGALFGIAGTVIIHALKRNK